MLRTTVICPTVSSLHASIVKFIDYCKDSGYDFSMFSFYDSVARFGSVDRIDEVAVIPFGYVGVHFHVAITLDEDDDDDAPNSDLTSTNSVSSKPASVPQTTVAADESVVEPSITEPAAAVESRKKVLQVEVQFHPSTIYDGTDTCVKETVYRRFTTRVAQEDRSTCLLARKAVEMQYAYAMSATPSD